jgi:glycosyltransferase involved in cell wall biosynthesis
MDAAMTRPAAKQRRGRRTRVVTLVDLLSNHGGAERFALQVAMGLDSERFESILCVSRWPMSPELAALAPAGEQAIEELRQSGTRFLPLRRTRKVDPAAWIRLERFLRREHVEILHSHKFGSNLWGSLVARAARVPVVVAHEHTWSYEGQPLRRFIDREVVSRYADRFVAVSQADRRRMTDVEGIDPSRTGFIPIGILPSEVSLGDRHVRDELGIAPEVPVIGIVGILRPQKAHEVLLRALSQLTDEFPDIQLLIVGDGPRREPIEQLIDELRLRGNVRVLGLRSDVPEILREIDVAACSSDFEGSPLSVMEYMDASLPIVATAVGGIPDLIESGEHGLLVPPGDPTALAQALAEMLRDRPRAKAMGERARERRRTEFDLRTVIGRIEELYCELLARRGMPVPGG